VTVAQREKLARLGGAEWVRGKIDRAKEPNVAIRHCLYPKRDKLGITT
jgi:hypothetical protein